METVVFHSPHPLVPLRFKDGPARAVSWAGFSFEPDEVGINWVPVEAVREMTESHGMVGVAGAVAKASAKADARDAYIAELEASNAMLRDRIAELEAPDPRPLKFVSALEQTTDGGSVRPVVFPAEGEHPMGGAQPALGDPPNEAEVKASQSEGRTKRGKGGGFDVIS